jgi:hypothetical protein
MTSNVLVLDLSLKYELEEAKRDIEKVVLSLGTRWHRKGKHQRCSLSFVVVTTETDKMLMDRLGHRLQRVGAVEKFHIFQAPRYALCSDGPIDPFSSAILDAWDVVRQRHQPQNVRKPERLGGRSFGPVKDRDGRTVR